MDDEKPVGIFVKKEIRNRIKQLAAKRGTTIRAVAEELFEAELQKNEKNDSGKQRNSRKNRQPAENA